MRTHTLCGVASAKPRSSIDEQSLDVTLTWLPDSPRRRRNKMDVLHEIATLMQLRRDGTPFQERTPDAAQWTATKSILSLIHI